MSDSHSFQANLARKNGRRGEGVQGEPGTKNGSRGEGVQGEPCAKKWPKMERSTRRTLYEKRHGY